MNERHGRTVVLTVETSPDERGKRQFMADWLDEYGGPHAQSFNTDLDATIDRWRAKGYVVVVVYGRDERGKTS